MTNQQANSALITEFKGSPEAKFFMVKFLSKFPNGSDRIDDFARFSRKLGFTKPVTTRCISELVRLGLLLDGRHQRGEKPYRIINLSTKLQELAHTERTTPLHQRHMDQLLVWGEEPLRERRHKLTINKRLVLLFLLAHADQAGIVRGISASKLSRCTGLNSQQTKNNIRLLTQHQYIANVLPGGNFPGTMGKASSIYKLDLRHPAYGNDRPPGIILLFQSRSVFDNELHEAAKLNLLIQKLANQDIDFIVPATEFKRYMKGRMSGPMQQRLQWEMLDIASLVISSRLGDPTESSRLIKSKISARVFDLPPVFNPTAP
ncbi:MAG: hypothetical protein RI567_13315 [Marinobacter sp.]|nr:hypothetical protein [Marinobacter sp.]